MNEQDKTRLTQMFMRLDLTIAWHELARARKLVGEMCIGHTASNALRFSAEKGSTSFSNADVRRAQDTVVWGLHSVAQGGAS